MSIEETLLWLEGMRLSLWILESLWGFSIVVGIHILSLTVSVGILVWFDLRLLGLGMRDCRVSVLYRRLMPWALSGFILMFLSGGSLFGAYATLAFPNIYFRIKMAALLRAAANAATYHLVTERNIDQWNTSTRPPLGARMAGLTSIVLWAAIIVSGRMISYTIF